MVKGYKTFEIKGNVPEISVKMIIVAAFQKIIRFLRQWFPNTTQYGEQQTVHNLLSEITLVNRNDVQTLRQDEHGRR